MVSYSGNTARKKIGFHSFSFQNSNNVSHKPLFYISFFYKKYGGVEDILRLGGFLLVTKRHLKAKAHTKFTTPSFTNPVE